MDSTTCLFQAIYDFRPATSDKAHIDHMIDAKLHGHTTRIPLLDISWVEAISVDYGQRHKKEFGYAKATCNTLGIKHSVLSLGGILSGDGVMLTDASVKVPDISYDDIKGVSPTYVPFRNGTLLALITAHAQKYVNAQIEECAKDENNLRTGTQEEFRYATDQAKDLCGIYFGAHSEDAHNWAYPDCTPEFIGAMANAIYTGTYNTIRLHTPIQWASKADVVQLGERLGVPWEKTWSCYKGEALQCGVCPTCRARKGAFACAGVQDPTEYAA
jgi:7-cyano-7-deazaguanine synthase